MNKFIHIILLFPVYAYGMHFSPIDGKYDCPDIQNSMECARHIESSLVISDPRINRKSQSELVVKIANGTVKTYVDRSDSNVYVENAAYTAIELLLNKRYLLLHRQFSEGSAYTLVNLSNGTELEINGFALASPNNKYVAVVEMDVTSEYNSNTLQLYRVTDTALELIYDAKPESWGPSNVMWQDSNQLIFNITTLSPEITSGSEADLYQKTPAKIIISADGKSVSLNKYKQRDCQTLRVCQPLL